MNDDFTITTMPELNQLKQQKANVFQQFAAICEKRMKRVLLERQKARFSVATTDVGLNEIESRSGHAQ